jgi:hypothetical protein
MLADVVLMVTLIHSNGTYGGVTRLDYEVNYCVISCFKPLKPREGEKWEG